MHLLTEINFSRNEITKIDRLDGFPLLKKADFSKNKIRSVDYMAFGDECEATFLSFDDNALKNLPFIFRLRQLKHLFAANNRIADLGDFEKFGELKELKDFDLSNNPVNRRPGYRFNLLKKLPNIETIDQKELSEDEKEQLYMHIMMAQGSIQPQNQVQNNIPPQLINQMLKGPIKVNALNFDLLPNIRLQNDHYIGFKK